MERNKLFIILYGVCFLLLGLVVVSVQYAPMFTLMIILICALVFMYVLTEHWKTHDAVEFENRFWTFIAVHAILRAHRISNLRDTLLHDTVLLAPSSKL